MLKFSAALRLSKLSFAGNVKTCKVCSNCDLELLSVYLRAVGSLEHLEYKVSLSGYQNLFAGLHQLQGEVWDGVVVILTLDDLFPELSYRTGAPWTYPGVRQVLEESDRRMGEYLKALVDVLRAQGSRALVLPPFLDAPPVSGHPEPLLHSALSNLLLQIETRLVDWVRLAPHLSVLNPRALFAGFTEADLRNDMLFFQSGNPFSPLVMNSLARAVHTWFEGRGEPKKLLVTDLDNTLWDGLIGEEGPLHIASHPEKDTYHHWVFQSFLKLLASEGVLLAVCSKNDRSEVESFFNDAALRSRAGVQLGPEEFVSLSCSWEAKSQQIARLCSQLNLLPGSTVFVDDDPLEILEVRKNLPEVTAVRFEKSKDIHNLLMTLRSLFYQDTVTRADESRTALYRLKAAAEKPASSFTSYAEFLESLQLTAQFSVLDDRSEERAFQLYNKTNQFNLTGHRLSDADWRAYLARPASVCVVGRLQDRFGDHGLVWVALLQWDQAVLRLDNAALSCRVFNRGMETAFLDWLSRTYKTACAMQGYYQPTAKNKYCADYFVKHGFAPVDQQGPKRLFSTTRFKFDDHCIQLVV